MVKKYNNNNLSAWLFTSPYIVILMLFLIFPFFKGLWMSFHEWNLLKVLFNPEAKKFIAFDNFVNLFWGEGLTWSVGHNAVSRFISLVLLGYIIVRIKKSSALGFSLSTKALLLVSFFIVIILMGIHPSDQGRWNDLRFWLIFKNTFIFVLWTVPLVSLFSLLLAVMLYKSSKLNTVLRVVFFSSNVLSVAVVTLIWQIMYSPQQGMIANILKIFGIKPILWITSPNLAMPAIVIVTIWWSLGFAMIIFIAGLQDIPPEYFEAAELDGANKFQIFRNITLPCMTNTIVLVVVIELILHFQVFGQSHLITQGGPVDSTQVLVRYIYQTGFRDSNLGYASAISVVLFFVMMCISLLQIKILSGKNE